MQYKDEKNGKLAYVFTYTYIEIIHTYASFIL